MPKPQNLHLDPIKQEGVKTDQERPPLIVSDIPALLAAAPLESPYFRFAASEFLEYVGSGRSLLENKPTIKDCLFALNRRFSDGTNLAALGRQIGNCWVVGMFIHELRTDHGQTTDGAMGRVNAFANEHLRTCSFCSMVLNGRMSVSDSVELEGLFACLSDLLGRLVHV